MYDFKLTDAEWDHLSRCPEEDLIALAADLEIVIPEEIDARSLFESCIPRMARRIKAEGMPLSEFDLDDLEELPVPVRAGLAKALGVRDSVRSLLRAGKKAYKLRRKQRPGNDPYLYMIPIVLTPLIRHLQDRS